MMVGSVFCDPQLSVTVKMKVFELIDGELFELQPGSYLETSHLYTRFCPRKRDTLQETLKENVNLLSLSALL